MLTLIGIGVGKFPSFDASAKTLTWTDAPLVDYDVDRIKLIINTANQSVLYHPSNPNLSISMNNGVITFTGANNNTASGSFNDSDRIFVWAQTTKSVGGIDPLSELALKTLQYSAMNDLDISTENLEVVSNNTAMESKLDELLSVPDAYVASGAASFTLKVGEDLSGIDLQTKSKIVNIRSTNDNTKVTAYRTKNDSNTAIVTDYNLGTDSFLDIKCEEIAIDRINSGSTPDAEVVIHTI